MAGEGYSISEAVQRTAFVKSKSSFVKAQSHVNHEKAPIFLDNPEADTHIASDIVPRSHTPRNERNMGRYIPPAKSLGRFGFVCSRLPPP
jgi:hypothetical protein